MINKELYLKLSRRFGDIRINNEGVPLEGFYRQTPGQKRLSLEVVTPGEEFTLSCPFCRDVKKRLTINHRWGVYDETTKSDNLWLAQCYRRQCLVDRTNQRRLYEMLYMRARGERKKSIGAIAAPGTVEKKEKRDPYEPGAIWPLKDLMVRRPKHPAVCYLRDRFFDLKELAEVFRVGYVVDSPTKILRERIYAPCYWDNKLVGWQCREVIPSGLDAPKWFTMPGMDRNFVLYNLDVAKQFDTVVIVEGPSSAWGVGPSAVATFGKTLSQHQIDLLARELKSDAKIVLLYDPDKPEKENKNKKHHIIKAYEALASSVFSGRVLPVVLPPDTDPGGLNRDYVWKQIELTAKQYDFPITRATT